MKTARDYWQNICWQNYSASDDSAFTRFLDFAPFNEDVSLLDAPHRGRNRFVISRNLPHHRFEIGWASKHSGALQNAILRYLPAPRLRQAGGRLQISLRYTHMPRKGSG